MGVKGLRRLLLIGASALLLNSAYLGLEQVIAHNYYIKDPGSENKQSMEQRVIKNFLSAAKIFLSGNYEIIEEFKKEFKTDSFRDPLEIEYYQKAEVTYYSIENQEEEKNIELILDAVLLYSSGYDINGKKCDIVLKITSQPSMEYTAILPEESEKFFVIEHRKGAFVQESFKIKIEEFIDTLNKEYYK